MAVQGDYDTTKLRQQMGKEGWELAIVGSADELYAQVVKPGCFGVFLGERFHSDSIALIRRGKTLSRASWMLVVQKASNSVNLRALDAGAMGIIHEPINPSQMFLRARQMWDRFTKEFGTDVSKLQPLVSPDKIPRMGSTMEAEALTRKAAPVMEAASRPSLDRMAREELLQEVRHRIQMLDTRTTYRKEVWRKDLLENLSESDSPEAVRKLDGLENAREGVRDLLKYVADQIAAGRITLISIRGDNTKAPEFPEQIVTLLSSDATMPTNAYIKSMLLPGVQVAFERKAPVILKTPTPLVVDGEKRPDFLKVKNKAEVATAVIPLHLTHDEVYGALLVQFEKVPNPLQVKMLEEAMSYMSVPGHSYLKIDFLSRFYRKLKHNKS